MSATSARCGGSAEEDYLRELKFEVIQSGIHCPIEATTKLPTITIEEFLEESRIKKRARLIFCSEGKRLEYEALAKEKGCVVKSNPPNINYVRGLTPYDCVIVSDLKLMRGVDYRAKLHGIDLLIAHQFPHDRSYV